MRDPAHLAGSFLFTVSAIFIMNHRKYLTVIAVLFIALALAVANWLGSSGRVYATPSLGMVSVDSPDKAVSLWQEKGLKGRILILFDRYPHFYGYAHYKNKIPVLTEDNFIEYAIFKNIVRSIYYIVPDNEWDGLRTSPGVRSIRPGPGLVDGVYLYNLNGVPLIATTLSSLPHLLEISLVYVNEELFDSKHVLERIRSKHIISDCIVLYRDIGN